jgi:hypothetical protein
MCQVDEPHNSQSDCQSSRDQKKNQAKRQSINSKGQENQCFTPEFSSNIQAKPSRTLRGNRAQTLQTVFARLAA